MPISNGCDERPQQPEEIVLGHSLLRHGLKHVLKAAVEFHLAAAVEIGIGVDVFQLNQKLPGILDELWLGIQACICAFLCVLGFSSIFCLLV